MRITPHYDYLLGFPSKIQNDMGSLIQWGVDSTQYIHKQTTGIILESPQAHWGPTEPWVPTANKLMPRERMLWAAADERVWFEGSLPILPAGTLVVVVPGWENLSNRKDFIVEGSLNERHPGYQYSMVQPMAIIGYCNASTNWQWQGYGGWVMMENAMDPIAISSNLTIVQDAKSKWQVRKVAGPGYNIETGRQFRLGELVMMGERQGVVSRINAGFQKTKVKEGIVTFVPGAKISATFKKNMMKKYKIQPESDWVLVQPEKPELWLGKGVAMPDSMIQRPERGEIIAVGPDVKGKKKGDMILYPERFGVVIETGDDSAIVLMREANLYATLKEDDEEGYSLRG